METLSIEKAIEELKKQKERKFDQTVELIINLRGVDIKRTNLSIVIDLPHKVKDKKVCGFLTKKNEMVKTITKPEFAKYKDPKLIRHLIKDYDFFIAHASLMPSVATTFGKALGPSGKMPSPQLGILKTETPEEIQKNLDKIDKAIKIRLKEASIKIPVGKQSMTDKQIIENVTKVHRKIVEALPTKKENVKKILLKLTMTKPLTLNL